MQGGATCRSSQGDWGAALRKRATQLRHHHNAAGQAPQVCPIKHPLHVPSEHVPFDEPNMLLVRHEQCQRVSWVGCWRLLFVPTPVWVVCLQLSGREIDVGSMQPQRVKWQPHEVAVSSHLPEYIPGRDQLWAAEALAAGAHLLCAHPLPELSGLALSEMVCM